MDSKHKARIAHMRRGGMGYSRIAQALGVSENTVKSYCKRNNLGGHANTHTSFPELSCRNCGLVLEQASGKKTRIFCSDNCRVAWWNTHLEAVNKKAIYQFSCPRCGLAFESYGNKSRKYCSHACYIRSRFPREGNKA